MKWGRRLGVVAWALVAVLWAEAHLWFDATGTVNLPLWLMLPGAALVYFGGRLLLPAHQRRALAAFTVGEAALLFGLSFFDVPDRYLRDQYWLWARGARSATVAEALADPPWWVELTDGRLRPDLTFESAPFAVTPIVGPDGRGGIWLCDDVEPGEATRLRGTLHRPDRWDAPLIARAAAARGLAAPEPLCFRWAYVGREAYEADAREESRRPLGAIHFVLALGIYAVVSLGRPKAQGSQTSAGSGS